MQRQKEKCPSVLLVHQLETKIPRNPLFHPGREMFLPQQGNAHIFHVQLILRKCKLIDQVVYLALKDIVTVTLRKKNYIVLTSRIYIVTLEKMASFYFYKF